MARCKWSAVKREACHPISPLPSALNSPVQSLPVDNCFQLCRPHVAIEETLSEGDAPVPLEDTTLLKIDDVP